MRGNTSKRLRFDEKEDGILNMSTSIINRMKTEIPGSESKKATATLDENDPIWMLIRHWHYADAVEYIKESFTKFITSNKAAAGALGANERCVF